MQELESVAQEIMRELEWIPVIDAHEHMPSEQQVVCKQADVFTRLYVHYTMTTAISAGFPDDRLALHDTSIPLEQRWAKFRPFLDAVKDSGYARAARLTARELYGIDDITDETYQELSDRLQADNKPGLYREIFKERCNIEVLLNQNYGSGEYGVPCKIVTRDLLPIPTNNAKVIRNIYGHYRDRSGHDFPGAAEMMECIFECFVADGVVGVKFHGDFPPLEHRAADEDVDGLLKKTLADTADANEVRALCTWLFDKALELAGKHHLVVAVHCGIVFFCWSDFTLQNPLKTVPYLIRHKGTSFDLYHGGIPWIRETGVIGNQYPNAHLNLVWCHQISPYMTEQAINEWIDLVPTNKIIGFAGDNCHGPEKTLGVLVMTRENIARALAVRLLRGQLTESRALDIARAWLYENPKRIYNI